MQEENKAILLLMMVRCYFIDVHSIYLRYMVHLVCPVEGLGYHDDGEEVIGHQLDAYDSK
mgnify:CR=1 FL=1